MIKFKEGCKISGAKSELVLGLMGAEGVYSSYGVALVVTEITGGKHGDKTLHPFGYAADLRTWNLPKDIKAKDVAAQIQEQLGDEYDVVFEATPEHIHLEFDPR